MEFEDGILIVTDSISINATVVVWALQHFSVGLKDLRIITQASLLEGSLYFKSSSLSTIISISEKPGFHTQLWLSELVKVLKPGGSVYLQEPSFFDGNKEFVLSESKASLLHNLLFTGFYSVEVSECLDHSAEISCSTQSFELIAIKAKRPWDADTSNVIHNRPVENPENPVIDAGNTLQPQTEAVVDFTDEGNLLATAEVLKNSELPLDNSFKLRDRIRERNRLYQRRRRAKMTEEQKMRERERRRQYMESRRVQPVSFEMPLPPSICYERANGCEQTPLCCQQLQGAQNIEMEHNQGTAEAGEAS